MPPAAEPLHRLDLDAAECTLTASSRPSVSVRMWRCGQAPSASVIADGRAKPPLTAPFAVWLSMIAVVGSLLGPPALDLHIERLMRPNPSHPTSNTPDLRAHPSSASTTALQTLKMLNLALHLHPHPSHQHHHPTPQSNHSLPHHTPPLDPSTYTSPHSPHKESQPTRPTHSFPPARPSSLVIVSGRPVRLRGALQSASEFAREARGASYRVITSDQRARCYPIWVVDERSFF